MKKSTSHNTLSDHLKEQLSEPDLSEVNLRSEAVQDILRKKKLKKTCIFHFFYLSSWHQMEIVMIFFQHIHYLAWMLSHFFASGAFLCAGRIYFCTEKTIRQSFFYFSVPLRAAYSDSRAHLITGGDERCTC